MGMACCAVNDSKQRRGEWSECEIGGPFLQDLFVRFDEMLLCKLSLLDGQLAALFPVIDNLRQRVILVLQVRLIESSCSRVGVVNFGTINSLKGFHRADGADQLEICVVAQQITLTVERQWCYAIWRHEKANLHSHFCEVMIGRRQFILLILHTQHGVSVFGSLICLAGRGANADDRRLVEMLPVSARIGKFLEQGSMQVAKIIRRAEFRSMGVVLRKQHTEIVVAHIGGKIVPHDAVDAFVRLFVENAGFQYLDQRKCPMSAVGINAHLNRDDLKLHRVAISRWVVPMRQVIEAVVNHLQRAAQVLLPTLSPSQIGKVGGYARAIQWVIALIEKDTFEIKGRFFVHCDSVS